MPNEINVTQQWLNARARLEQSAGDAASPGKALDFAAYVYGHGSTEYNNPLTFPPGDRFSLVNGYRLLVSTETMQGAGFQHVPNAPDFNAAAYYDIGANTVYIAFRGSDDLSDQLRVAGTVGDSPFFTQGAERQLAAAKEFVEASLFQIEEYAGAVGQPQIVVAGDSQGAVGATVAAGVLQQYYGD